MKAVLLEQNILAPITPVSIRIIQMLATIQFNCYVCICVEQVNFHSAPTIERNRQFCIEPESSGRLRQKHHANRTAIGAKCLGVQVAKLASPTGFEPVLPP